MRLALYIGLAVLITAAIGLQGWMIWREMVSDTRSRTVIVVRSVNIVLLLGVAGLVVFLLARG